MASTTKHSVRRVAACWLQAVLLGTLLGACAKPAPRTMPLDAAALARHGLMLAQHGEDFAAEQYLEAARKAGYPEQEAVRQLVGVCLQAGRIERGLTHAESYLEQNPDDWVMRHLVASMLFAKGDDLRARHELETLLAEHPEHAESQFLLGVVLRDRYSDVAATRGAFERYLALAPTGTHAGEARGFLRRAAAFPVAQQLPVQASLEAAR